MIRVGYLDAVVSSFGTLMAAHRGEVVCSVTTAKALDGAMKKDVEGAVKGFLQGKEKALISWSVDPKLIGGMVGIVMGVGSMTVTMLISFAGHHCWR